MNYNAALGLAIQTRTVFDHLLKVSRLPGSRGSCLYGSILLTEAFAANGVPAYVRGGDGIEDGYLVTPVGPRGHYWVSVELDGTEHFADITADQFGLAPVILKQVARAPEYQPGDQETVDGHCREVYDLMRAQASNPSITD